VSNREQTAAERATAARLLSLASHELRTPVSVVSGYLRMLLRDDTLSERQKKMVDEADKACAKLVGIITELSDVGKLDDGRTTMLAEGLDLSALLKEIAEAADEAADRDVTLSLEGCDRHIPMRGDRAHLRLAFSSLVRAVLREQVDGTVVVMKVEVLGGDALIVIGRDDVVHHVARSPEAEFDDQRGGLGLALPIARRVIEGHHGRIWSPADADGAATARSAVFVTLPLDREGA